MLSDGTTELECSVLDVAPGGARIVTEAEMDVGDHFTFVLVASHNRRQRCEVVWRRDKTFGVKFLIVKSAVNGRTQRSSSSGCTQTITRDLAPSR